MVTGDPASWDDFFQQGLVPTVLGYVVECWHRMRAPAADEREDQTSLRLWSEMKRGKDRQKHPFLIRYQDVEIDTDLARETGRKDIVFFPPANDEDLYFCLEAKRLNALVAGRRKSLADEYVKEGMRRFVIGKYARHVRHGGMLAYVLDGRVPRAMKNVERNIRSYVKELGMDAPGGFLPSGARPNDHFAKETQHRRTFESGVFRIHHLFVSGDASKSTQQRKK